MFLLNVITRRKWNQCVIALRRIASACGEKHDAGIIALG
jgi:hypothetical protein